jgi:sulfite dehydrogenase (cytochrome) subunit B
MTRASLLAALALAMQLGWSAAHAADMPSTSPSPAPARPPLVAKSITIPHDEPYLPPLPGHDAFVSNCVICHTPRYISGQPNFPRAVWTAEVNKMIKVYGAPIAQADVAAIVNYLVAWNGQEDKKP